MTSPKREIRRYRRTHAWDYSRGASLFITIATASRRPLFGHVGNGITALSPLGAKVLESLEAIPRLNPGIRLYGHVVMPDHVHFNIYLEPGRPEPLNLLGNAIRRFKNYTTKLSKSAEYNSAFSAVYGAAYPAPASFGHARRASSAYCADGRAALSPPVYSKNGPILPAHVLSADGRAALGRLWQQGYHDRLCLCREFIDSTERYIHYNPLKWELMHGTDHALRIHEPLDSPRLDAADYWKGVGNTALLGDDEKIVSLRISRKCNIQQITAAVRRMDAAIDAGYTIISGFISPGEKAVRDRLCDRDDAKFIRILPSCLPNARFKPESRYVPAFATGRYLEIARGNDEVAFGRGACLDYNAEIVEIATAAPGLALYWQPDGPHKIAEFTP